MADERADDIFPTNQIPRSGVGFFDSDRSVNLDQRGHTGCYRFAVKVRLRLRWRGPDCGCCRSV